MKFIDFFSGIGGFSLALKKAGFELAGYCEIDPNAVRSFRAIHDMKEGDCWYASDIRKVNSRDIPRSDIWTAGFPCQDISISNSNRTGLDGERSGLFFELVRLLKGRAAEARPYWIILENVKNLLSVHDGWDFAKILNSMAALGYDIEYGLLNSRFFGVPQSRERVFIVARRHTGTQCTGKVFPILAADGKALIQLIGGQQGVRIYHPKGIASTLTSNGGGLGAKTGLYLTNYSFMDLSEKSELTGISRCVKAKQNAGVGKFSGNNSGVCCVCARAVITPDREQAYQTGRRIKGQNEPMFCLTATDRHSVLICGCKECAYNMDMENFCRCIRIRRLTPRETWRLQAFDDSCFDKAAAVCSDEQLYRQAGNSVTVSVVYAIALRIKKISEEGSASVENGEDHRELWIREAESYQNTRSGGVCGTGETVE